MLTPSDVQQTVVVVLVVVSCFHCSSQSSWCTVLILSTLNPSATAATGRGIQVYRCVSFCGCFSFLVVVPCILCCLTYVPMMRTIGHSFFNDVCSVVMHSFRRRHVSSSGEAEAAVRVRHEYLVNHEYEPRTR